ncbi:excisionase family DNA-binding protein [uncultured Selenomonas sp.]|uniref:excisionase family DNA-binding protein n=1 Tax=uncultured Selenomonas sp. TaxID=159275 RepID=UPI0026747D66|nr:excisionase family DNA-binding protein [uncultured Selenomonas sp.]
MSVRELAERMGISLLMAYDLTRRADFPSIRVGARILIPVEAFHTWLVKEASHKA